MIIDITDEIKFDTEKKFEEQSFECQNYFYDVMNKNIPIIERDSFNRPVRETWFDDGINWNIVRVSVYQKQEFDWHMQSQIIELEECK